MHRNEPAPLSTSRIPGPAELLLQRAVAQLVQSSDPTFAGTGMSFSIVGLLHETGIRSDRVRRGEYDEEAH